MVKHYARLDEQGAPTAFYHGDFVPEQPVDSIELTPDQYDFLINHQGESRLVNGEIIHEPFPILEPKWPRTQRDRLLADSDWTQMADAPLSATQVQAWRSYRRALRELPERSPDPANITWPATPPAQA